MKPWLSRALGASVLLSCLVWSPLASAATLLWDATTGSADAQDGSGTWSVGPNWRNTVTSVDNVSFANGDSVTFGAGSGAASTVTVNQTGGVSTNSITFNAPGSSTYTIAGSGATGTITMTTGTIAANVDAVISAIIAGTGTLTKSGTGRLTLSGANTFTGALAITAGTVNLQNAAGAGTTAGGVTVSSGAALELQGGLSYGSETLTINGTGISSAGALRNVSGSNTWAGGLTLASASQITAAAGSLAISGTVSGAFGLTVTTGASATVALNGAVNNLTSLNVNIDATSALTLGGNSTNGFTGAVNLNTGTLVLSKSPNSDSQLPQAIANTTTVNIGNGSAAVILRLDRSQQIGDTGTVLNFSGSGSTAGTLRLNGQSDVVGTIKSATAGAGIIENNASAASTLTVNNSTSDTFSGVIRNGSTGALNFAKTNTGTLTLASTNSYTGSTSVRNGTLEITGASTLTTSTSYVLNTGGTLKLTNTATSNVTDRLGNSTALTSYGGTLWLADDTTTATYAETIGSTQFLAGSSALSTASTAAGTTTLTVTSIARSRGATVTFTGTALGTNASNRILLTTVPSLDHALLGGWAVTGNEFAKYDATNGVTALTAGDYLLTGESTWTWDANAKLTASTTLTADRRLNTLNLQQASATTFNLGGNALRVEAGGILVSGSFSSTISNGTLTGGTSSNSLGELIIHQQSANPLTISATIADNGTRATALVKSGTGSLVLSGSNTFTGGIYLNAGTLQLAGANALGTGNVSTNALALEGGTLDLNGYDLTIGALSSQANNTAGIITNTGAGPKTLTVGSGGASSAFNGQLASSGVNFTKTGNGILDFNQQNASYGGITTVAAGTLRTGGSNSLGVSGSDASRTIILAGATLDIANGINRNERLEIAGHGVNGLGAIIANSGDSQNIQYATLTGDTTLSVNIRYDFDFTLAGGGFSLTKVGSAELALEGASVQNLGNIHIKQGTITWSGSADLGDAAKTLYVDSGATAQYYNHVDDSKIIVLNGGTLRRAGNDNTTGREIDAAGGVYLNAGASSISHSGSALVFQLNTINRQVGATVNVDTSASLATTDTTLTAGILGGYMTIGNADWATKTSDVADGTISAYTAYAANDFATSTNNVTVSGSAAASSATVNSLRFNSASTTLTLTGENTVSTGGVLITSSASSSSITGGTLKGSASGDLIVINFANFSIASVIANNGGDTALTKSGSSTLTLTGANSYTGGTFINLGTLSVALLADTGNSNLGNSTGGSNNSLTFNGAATLAYTGSVDTTTARDVKILSGGGAIDVTASRTLTLTGILSGEALVAGEGIYVNEAKFTKAGTGTLTLAGSSANTLTGITEITAGILRLNKSTGVTAIAGNINLGNNAGGLDILQLDASEQIADTSILTLNGSGATAGIFRLAGQSETIGGLSSASSGMGIVENESGAANTATVAVNVATGATLTFTGVLRNGDGTGTDGTLAFTKSGSGTQILGGTNTYTGATTISGGSLQLGSGGTAGSISSTSGIALSNGANLTVNRSDALTLSQAVTGSGSFTQAGTGTTTLSSNASTYSGTTEVNAGTLVVTNTTGSSTGASTVWVNGATLAGTGIISGATTVREGGLLTPGTPGVANGIGKLTFGDDLTLKRSTLSSAPVLTMQLGTASDTVFNDASGISANLSNLATYFNSQLTTYESESGIHDRLTIGGTLHLEAGAVINVDNSLGYIPKFGDVFDLFDWSTLDVNASTSDRAWSANLDLLLPTLNAGLVYDLSLFSTNGLVVVVPEPGRASLLLLAAGGFMLRRRRRY